MVCLAFWFGRYFAPTAEKLDWPRSILEFSWKFFLVFSWRMELVGRIEIFESVGRLVVMVIIRRPIRRLSFEK